MTYEPSAWIRRLRVIAQWGALALAVAILISGGRRLYKIMSIRESSFALNVLEADFGKYLFFAGIFVLVFLELRWRIGSNALRRLRQGGWVNLALVAASLAVGVVLLELALRPLGIAFHAANRVVEAKRIEGSGVWAWAEPHPRIGFVPDHGRDAHGALKGPHTLEKRPGVRRVMFTGDSIAETRFLERAVAARTVGAGIEFLNTGVSSYSTAQERMYFEEYGRRLRPDLLILEFCLNDFDGTPVVFRDSSEGFVVLIPNMGRDEYNAWLFVHSTLYRFYLSLKKALVIDPRGRPGRMQEMKDNLARFQAMAAEDGFRFKVVVHPIMDHRERWTGNDRLYHQAILRILGELGIEHFDLAPLLDEVLKDRPVPWTRLFENDRIHPSEQFAQLAADYLLARGLLK